MPGKPEAPNFSEPYQQGAIPSLINRITPPQTDLEVSVGGCLSERRSSNQDCQLSLAHLRGLPVDQHHKVKCSQQVCAACDMQDFDSSVSDSLSSASTVVVGLGEGGSLTTEQRAERAARHKEKQAEKQERKEHRKQRKK